MSSKVSLTDSAVRGEPSEKVTSSRSSKVKTVASSFTVYDSASHGSSSFVSGFWYRSESTSWRVTYHVSLPEPKDDGLSEIGSFATAKVRSPPSTGFAEASGELEAPEVPLAHEVRTRAAESAASAPRVVRILMMLLAGWVFPVRGRGCALRRGWRR